MSRSEPWGPSEDLVEANLGYYQAFEAADMDAMSERWERSDRAICTHPGWATLRGWGAVAASFFTLFQHGATVQFVLTNLEPVVAGNVGWVCLDENLLGEQTGVTVASLNLFMRDRPGSAWRMVCHHGSVVHALADP